MKYGDNEFMSNKLSFRQMQLSLNAVNQFQNEFGVSFKALIMENNYGSNCSSVFEDEDVYIHRGEYDDANMPYVVVRNVNYDCAYVLFEKNDDCLTIKLSDKTIDIIPGVKER